MPQPAAVYRVSLSCVNDLATFEVNDSVIGEYRMSRPAGGGRYDYFGGAFGSPVGPLVFDRFQVDAVP